MCMDFFNTWLCMICLNVAVKCIITTNAFLYFMHLSECMNTFSGWGGGHYLHHPLNFTPDAIFAATLPIYPGLRQEPNMLDCIPGGLVAYLEAEKNNIK